MALLSKDFTNSPCDFISLEDFTKKIKKQFPQPKVDQILEAYAYSKKAHHGQVRRNGDPYITHPISVAGILSDQNLDSESLITALLHDVVEDTDVSLEDIKKKFGETVTFLLDGVTKISQMNFRNTHHKQSENIRKMIVAMGRDVRIILIKLADRLHNLRTLQYLSPQKQKSIADETLEIYTPLASRLGMNEIKIEMEDLSFKFSHPDNFLDLTKKMKEINKDKNIFIDQVVTTLKKNLQSNKIWDYQVTGRYKNLYSIYRKMTQLYISFEEIYDLVAFRICVKEIHECYESLGLVHALWKPVPGRFKDFIAMPKKNNYQSLHTTVLGPNGRQIEIQIRTNDMDITAERGIAAHWAYKLKNQTIKPTYLSKFNWLQSLVSWHKNSNDSMEFLENIKGDLFEFEIYVFTPKGEIKELPKKATVVDFAYAIHTQVGERSRGAKVNGRQVPLSYRLKSGDTIEIITEKQPKPSKDWLKFCVTSKARSKIKNFFISEERKKALEIGKKIFAKGCSNFKISEKNLLSHSLLSSFMESKGFNQESDLFIDLGFGKLIFKQVITFLQKSDQKNESIMKNLKILPITPDQQSSDSPLIIEGSDNIMIHFAKCCYPIAGDRVKSYVNRKRGVMVHRDICKSLDHIESDRFIDVHWRNEQSQDNDYTLSLRILCIDKPGTLSKMSKAFDFFSLNITNLKVNYTNSLKVFIIFNTQVKSLIQTNQLIVKLSQIDNVLSVKRHIEFC